jgi:hypothetical protein
LNDDEIWDAREIGLTSLLDQLHGAQLMTAGTQQREGYNAVTRGNFSLCGAVKHAGLSNIRQKIFLFWVISNEPIIILR